VLTRGSLKIQEAKKSPKICHLGTITQLCPAISLQLRHISTIRTRWLYCLECPQYSTRRRSASNIHRSGMLRKNR